MQVFMTLAVILGLTALFSYINERFLHLQQTIGLMVLALGFTLVLMVLSVFELTAPLANEQALVTHPALDETLLNGVLCFMLFAGSINVNIRVLGEESGSSSSFCRCQRRRRSRWHSGFEQYV